MPVEVPHPSLLQVLEPLGLGAKDADVGIVVGHDGVGLSSPREDLFLIGETQNLVWHVPTLTSLFRGNAVPPEMNDYPVPYIPLFAKIESRVLTMATAGGRAPTDGEIHEIYNGLRRRPDGRSTGQAHDNVWRVCAFTLGHFAVSAQEFEAVMGRLAKSAKTWRTSAGSRNYVDHLAKMFRPKT